LLIYDVTLAGLVPLLGSYDTGGSAQGVAVRKNLAAVADYSSLLLFDVSNPATPTPTGGLGGLTAWGVASTGNLVALAADSQGLKMVDVSDPAAPAVVGTFDTIGRASEVKMMANHALVEDFGYSSGIYIVDISDPTIPRLAGFFTKRAFVAAPYAADGRTIYLGETVYNPNTFVNAYSLRAGAWRPTLLTRYATASAGGANLVYSLSWPETATPTEQDVSCWVTGGTCTVSVVDQTLNTATVTWTPPATADDHEIVIAVGTQHYFISEVDRVSFQ
jgi:hypothetical protein